MTKNREFDADNWTETPAGSLSCGICREEFAPVPAHRAPSVGPLSLKRGAFLAHSARHHLPLLAGAFNSYEEAGIG